MVIKGLQIFWGPFYDWLDGRWLGHMLRANEKTRFAIGQEMRARGDEPLGWRVHRPTGIATAATLVSCIIVGWVVSRLATSLKLALYCIFIRSLMHGITSELRANVNSEGPPETADTSLLLTNILINMAPYIARWG
jgi:hypothetical protein